MRGVIKKKAGKNACVDFSGSGGEADKWVKVDALEHAGSDPADPAPAPAPAPAEQPAAEDEAAAGAAAPEPEPGLQQGGALRQQDFVAGLAVRKCADPSAMGTVLKRDGQRARVDQLEVDAFGDSEAAEARRR